MSRKTISAVLGLYFAVALAFGLFMELGKPFASFNLNNSAFVGRVVGATGSVFVLAGIIPMIVWAFGRLRADRAVGPLVIWALLGVAFMGLSGLGAFTDRKNEISQVAGNIASLSGGDYDAFIRNAKLSCIEGQRKSQINRQGGVTEQQIENYCQCFASAMAKAVTADDIVSLTKGGKLSAATQEKAQRIAPNCSRMALGR